MDVCARPGGSEEEGERPAWRLRRTTDPHPANPGSRAGFTRLPSTSPSQHASPQLRRVLAAKRVAKLHPRLRGDLELESGPGQGSHWARWQREDGKAGPPTLHGVHPKCRASSRERQENTRVRQSPSATLPTGARAALGEEGSRAFQGRRPAGLRSPGGGAEAVPMPGRPEAGSAQVAPPRWSWAPGRGAPAAAGRGRESPPPRPGPADRPPLRPRCPPAARSKSAARRGPRAARRPRPLRAQPARGKVARPTRSRPRAPTPRGPAGGRGAGRGGPGAPARAGDAPRRRPRSLTERQEMFGVHVCGDLAAAPGAAGRARAAGAGGGGGGGGARRPRRGELLQKSPNNVNYLCRAPPPRARARPPAPPPRAPAPRSDRGGAGGGAAGGPRRARTRRSAATRPPGLRARPAPPARSAPPAGPPRPPRPAGSQPPRASPPPGARPPPPARAPSPARPERTPLRTPPPPRRPERAPFPRAARPAAELQASERAPVFGPVSIAPGTAFPLCTISGPSELRSPSLSSRPESDLTSATGDEEALATWERRPPSTMAPTSWLGTPNNSWAVGTASPPDRRTAKAGKDDSVEHRHSAARRKPAFEPEPCPGGAWASEGVDPHRPQGPSGLWGSTAFAPHPVRQPATLC
ncbi:PREDICTED: serine/arginine repetitive matrix protein 1-like [Capra hircus]|uniref:serine/arginine repetitive matrix protein 1-like n=1 Tax=Capra hircus TaxID=9925 RepID=UPI00084637AB|nr:PREDICTED: serine/arginine repetitive matrix protein 1-like [Capra hircus]